jgi:hypothetical protein
MPRSYFVVVCLLAATVSMAPAGAASAQQFSFRSGAQAVQSLSVGYVLIDFTFDGRNEPPFRFDFDQPAYGLVYTRPHFMVTLALGNQHANDSRLADLRLIDVSLTTWGELRLRGLSAGTTRFYLPIVLHGNHRRVSPRTEEESLLDAFNVSVLGLGAGLALDRTFGDATFFEARANPIVGIATSSLTDAFGLAYLIDADAQLHRAALFGRLGLSLGYTFRYQVWNINASDLFPDAADDLFDYKGLQHLLRVGLNW